MEKKRPSKFYISQRKAILRLWKIPYRTHNKFIYIINNGMPIVITLEKRCIKYLWNKKFGAMHFIYYINRSIATKVDSTYLGY